MWWSKEGPTVWITGLIAAATPWLPTIGILVVIAGGVAKIVFDSRRDKREQAEHELKMSIGIAKRKFVGGLDVSPTKTSETGLPSVGAPPPMPPVKPPKRR